MLMGSSSIVYRVTSDPGICVHVSELACCALEVGSAVTSGLLERETAHHGPRRVDVMLISGTVTHLLAPLVVAQWVALSEPKLAFAIGACASSGGPYWDAPTVLNGMEELIPVSGFIAGCPPSPESIVESIMQLLTVS
jgi:NADH-quinone oxidoreductase subunit B